MLKGPVGPAGEGLLHCFHFVSKELWVFKLVLFFDFHVHKNLDALLDLVDQSESVEVR